jgi:hypothetical protein
MSRCLHHRNGGVTRPPTRISLERPPQTHTFHRPPMFTGVIAFMLFCLALVSAAGIALSVVLHVGFWTDGSGFAFIRQVLAQSLVAVLWSTAALMIFLSRLRSSKQTFERPLRGAPGWAMPTLFAIWAYVVWTSVLAANELFGLSDPEHLLLASSAFLGIYSTLFAINHAAFMRLVGLWSDR